MRVPEPTDDGLSHPPRTLSHHDFVIVAERRPLRTSYRKGGLWDRCRRTPKREAVRAVQSVRGQLTRTPLCATTHVQGCGVTKSLTSRLIAHEPNSIQFRAFRSVAVV